MKILIDRNGLQTQRHLQDKHRLCTFLTELLSSGYSVAFSRRSMLTADELHDCNVLVITTRWNVGYGLQELDDVLGFVRDGGGLLLLSNHADWHRNRNDARKHDQKLASRYRVSIERTFFANRQKGLLTRLQGSCLNEAHPIIRGLPGEEPVRCIVTNTCASIVSDQGDRVISLTDSMTDRRNGNPPSEMQLFAHALDSGQGPDREARGRVVTIGDSGFIGSVCTNSPGRGLLELDDNLHFALNAIRWLGGELGA